MIKNKFLKSIICFSVMIMLVVAGTVMANAQNAYFDPYKIYTEGIYVSDGLYIEPCFEHFKDQDAYPALNIKGEVPSGTVFRLYIQDQAKKESIKESSEVPFISGLGVYRVEVVLPGSEPVNFQAEIVLEGFVPCRKVTVTEMNNGELTSKRFNAFSFTNDYRRKTYNIRRGENPGGVPGENSYKVVMRQFENPSETYDYVRKLETIRAHTLILDISGGTLASPQSMVMVGTQVYDEYFTFATHDEMQMNRDTYGK